jgi:hypothetical protein
MVELDVLGLLCCAHAAPCSHDGPGVRAWLAASLLCAHLGHGRSVGFAAPARPSKRSGAACAAVSKQGTAERQRPSREQLASARLRFGQALPAFRPGRLVQTPTGATVSGTFLERAGHPGAGSATAIAAWAAGSARTGSRMNTSTAMSGSMWLSLMNPTTLRPVSSSIERQQLVRITFWPQPAQVEYHLTLTRLHEGALAAREGVLQHHEHCVLPQRRPRLGSDHAQ